MKIKLHPELDSILGVYANEFSGKVIGFLTPFGLGEADMGFTVGDFCHDNDIDVLDVFLACAPKTAQICIMHLLSESYIMGDGDCPECGYKLVLVDAENYRDFPGTRDLPPSYRNVWADYRCPHCSFEKRVTENE